MRNLHVLGVGSMGALVAHELSLRGLVTPTLLFKNTQRLDDYNSNDLQLTIVRRSGDNTTLVTSKLTAMVAPSPNRGQDFAPITDLLIATKAHQTEAALRPYLPALRPNLNIYILQNGMGAAERLCGAFWPQKAQRPDLYLLSSTHGAYKTFSNVVHHVGLGKLSVARAPGPEAEETPIGDIPDVVSALLDAKNLNCEYLDSTRFLFIQCEKLVANACINPLLALLDCLNGDLLHGSGVQRIMRQVVEEAIAVLQLEYPQLAERAESGVFWDSNRLLGSVLDVVQATASNSSSMREDLRALNVSEVDYINGYIVGLGRKYKVRTPVNAMLADLVRSRLQIDRALEKNAAPLASMEGGVLRGAVLEDGKEI